MAIAWLFKSVIQLGKDVVAIQTAFRIYLEGTSKGAARVLDSPNPTPPQMRVLLRKYERKELTEEERGDLKQWLRELKNAPDADKSERSAAVQLLASMEAMKALNRGSR
jgi:hypothetical protein